VSSIFGPAIAGALVATLGSIWTLALTAAMYVVAAAVTLGLRDPLGRVPHGALLSDAWDGLVYVAKHPTLRGLAISVSTNNIANGLFFIGLPVLVLTRLGGGPAQVGQLFALSGITAAISVLFFGRFGTEGRERPLMAGSMLVIGLGYLLTLLSPSLLFAAVALLIVGLATGPFDIVLFTTRQRDHERRALSFAIRDRDRAAVQLHDLAYEVEAQADAAAIGLLAIEGLEELLAAIGRDPGSVVADRDAHCVLLDGDAHVDRLVGRSVLRRIVDEVEDNLFHPHRVEVDQFVFRGGNDVDQMARAFGVLVRDGPDERGDVGRRALQHEAPRPDARAIQQALEQNTDL